MRLVSTLLYIRLVDDCNFRLLNTFDFHKLRQLTVHMGDVQNVDGPLVAKVERVKSSILPPKNGRV